MADANYSLVKTRIPDITHIEGMKDYGLDKIESVQKSQVVVAGIEIPIGEGYRNSLQTYVADKNL